jgi:hypothetical protein
MLRRFEEIDILHFQNHAAQSTAGLDRKIKRTMIIRSVDYYLAVDMAQHPRRFKSPGNSYTKSKSSTKVLLPEPT